MPNPISRFLSMITHLGAPQQDPETYKRVVFANRVAVIMISASLIYFLVYLSFGWYSLAFTILAASLPYLPTLALNRANRRRAAGAWTIFNSSASMLSFSLLLGEEVGVQYLLIPLTGFPYILFGRSERVSRSVGFAFPVACFLAFHWISKSGYAPQPLLVVPAWAYLACASTCFVISGFIYRQFSLTLSEAQEGLKRALESEVAARTQELQRLSERYLLASKATNDSIYEWDIATNALSWNDNFYSTFGYSDRAQVASLEWWSDSIHPDDRKRTVQDLDRFLAQGGTYWAHEYRMRKASGQYAFVLDRGYIARDPGGKPGRMVGSILDLTDRKKVEEEIRTLNESLEQRVQERTALLQSSHQALREASEQFVQIANNIDGALWVSSISGDALHYVSPTVERVFGLPSESYYENPMLWVEQIHPEDRAMTVEALGKAAEGAYIASYRVIHAKTRATRWISARGTIAFDAEGKPSRLIGVALDITQQKESEDLIARQQMKMLSTSKLSTLGEMAGGIAHEINNPLAIIQGRATQLLDAAKNGTMTAGMVAKMAESIFATSDRIAKIIRAMRSFARDVDHDPFASAGVGQILEDTFELCRERFRIHGIQLTVDEVPADLQIECRSVQIGQVLLNLLSNAHDAAEPQSDPWVRVEVKDAGEGIEISVTDSGCGIPRGLAEKIFQPFFTTKAVGKGTGLGLSLSSSIIHEHSGRLWIDEGCANTRFSIWLPKRQAASAPAPLEA